MEEIILNVSMMILIGFIIGGFFCLLFFQTDNKWVQMGETLIGIGGGNYVFEKIVIITKITDKIGIRYSFLGGYLGIVLGFVIGVIFIRNILRNQKDPIPLRMMDLIFHYSKALEQYYDMRKKNIDKQTEKENEKLKNEQKEYENKNKILIEKEKKLVLIEELKEKLQRIQTLEKNFYENKEYYYNSIKDIGEKNICYSIPVDKYLFIDSYFIKDSISYVEQFSIFSGRISLLTDETIKQIEILKKDGDNSSQKKEKIKSTILGYLTGTCQMIVDILFDRSSKVRISYRCLNNNNYECIVVFKKGISCDSINYRVLNPIPVDSNNMIKKSYEQKKPIIKNYNNEYHYQTDTKEEYDNYWTAAFYEMNKYKIAFLSMNISIIDEKTCGTRLTATSIFRLDKTIQKELLKINKVIELNISPR